MKLLADGNFPLSSVHFLEDQSPNIIHIGRDFAGTNDKEVINLANQENRTILTFDKDYGTLIFKFNYRPIRGVIFLRLNEYTPRRPGIIVANLLDSKEFHPENKLTVVTESGIRQRRY